MTPTTRRIMTTHALPLRQKRCARCGVYYPLHTFNYDAKAADGRQSYCPPCKATATAAAAELRAAHTPYLEQHLPGLE
jgi:hypothetical protein